MSKRWIPGALLCGWLGWTGAVSAQAPLPEGPTVPTAPPASIAPPTEVAQLPENLANPVPAADPSWPGAYGAYPWGMPSNLVPPGPVAPQRPFEPTFPGDGIAITAFEPEATLPDTGTTFTVRFDYLNYWTKNRGLPLLVTSGFAADRIPGAVGQPTTSQVIGGAQASLTNGASARDRSFDANNHTGYRIGFGAWFDGSETCAIDFSFFHLLQRNAHRTVTTDDLNTPQQIFPVVLARPFYNFVLFREDAVQVATPPGQYGMIETSIDRMIYGGEANLRFLSPYSTFTLGRCGLIFGARYLQMDTGLEINQYTESTAGLPGFRPNTVLTEQLNSWTKFYGGQAGVEYEMCYGGFVLNFNSKLALGASSQKLTNFASSTVRNSLGAPLASGNTGVIVQPSNAGSYKNVEFAYVAEAGVTLGYEFNDWVRINVGYNLLYWDKVLEPEDQIDRAVNGLAASPAGTPGARPTVRLKADDFYMQGLSFGLQFSW